MKALLVVGILTLGFAFYSRATGRPLTLGLRGLTGTAPAGVPPATVASAPMPATTAKRTAAVNPAKVAAL